MTTTDENKGHVNGEKEDSIKIYPSMLPLDTLFVWFIGILNSKTWEYLGLIMNSETKEISLDLDKAKISIDSIEFLLNQISGFIKKEDKRQIEDMLASLQMNYVDKIKEQRLN